MKNCFSQPGLQGWEQSGAASGPKTGAVAEQAGPGCRGTLTPCLLGDAAPACGRTGSSPRRQQPPAPPGILHRRKRQVDSWGQLCPVCVCRAVGSTSSPDCHPMPTAQLTVPHGLWPTADTYTVLCLSGGQWKTQFQNQPSERAAGCRGRREDIPHQHMQLVPSHKAAAAWPSGTYNQAPA